ncbi:MAG: RecX family transcriptional regulator [Clostridiales bacterium]|nr:RecX family transcriptional regulator [Clostridiales bacterium]
MIITDIQKQKHKEGRYSVFIDGEFAFGIDGVDLLWYKLETGKVVSPELLNEITVTNAYIKAKNSALKFLGYRMRSRKEIEDRLKRDEFSPSIIEKTLSFLEEYGYIDDEAFAKAYIEEKKKLNGYGIVRLKSELYKKGIDRSIIDSLTDLMTEGEEELIEKALYKKLKGEKITDRKQRQKLLGYLLRKGFGYEPSLSVIEKYEELTDEYTYE